MVILSGRPCRWSGPGLVDNYILSAVTLMGGAGLTALAAGRGIATWNGWAAGSGIALFAVGSVGLGLTIAAHAQPTFTPFALDTLGRPIPGASLAMRF